MHPAPSLLVLTAVLLLAGCTTTYRIQLSNSDVIVARGRPRLVNGYYVFKDAQGQEVRINQLRVRSIEAD